MCMRERHETEHGNGNGFVTKVTKVTKDTNGEVLSSSKGNDQRRFNEEIAETVKGFLDELNWVQFFLTPVLSG